jgi:hypothetical protein
MESTSLDTQTYPLRNEAQLNCVSLRPSLDYEIGWRAVKGPDERCLTATPLTALHPLEDFTMQDGAEINVEGPPRRLDFYDLLIEALKIPAGGE